MSRTMILLTGHPKLVPLAINLVTFACVVPAAMIVLFMINSSPFYQERIAHKSTAFKVAFLKHQYLTSYSRMNRLMPLLFFFICSVAHAQHIFPEKFFVCHTGPFDSEKEAIIARINQKKLIEVITNAIDKTPKPPVWGRLSLQIVVDAEGHSCLLSMHNQTTLLSTQLNLKKDIDQHLVWEKPARKVAALVVIDFFGRRTAVKRVAFDENTGWHELTAKAKRVKKMYYYNYYPQ